MLANKSLNAAFSLIELMVVIAIVAILAAVAVPAYKDYIRNAKISESRAISENVLEKLVLYYNTKGKMPTSLTQVGITPDPGNVTQTIFPTTKADYPYTNIALLGFGASDSAGQCPNFTTNSYIVNLDSQSVYDGNPPYLHFIINAVEVDGTLTHICGFYDIRDMNGPSATTSLPDCYNLIVPAQSSVYSANLTAMLNGC